MREAIKQAIKQNQDCFDLDLPEEKIELLAEHHALVREHDPMLHLVAPCTPAEFAVRHILESLTMLEFLDEGARLADVGPGGGFPSVPCLIVRDDLTGVLIESKVKKAEFLRSAVEELGLGHRAAVVNKQFSEFPKPAGAIACCRALDRFSAVLPKLLKWSGRDPLLLFGGPALREALTGSKRRFTEKLMPLSEQRYLFRLE